MRIDKESQFLAMSNIAVYFQNNTVCFKSDSPDDAEKNCLNFWWCYFNALIIQKGRFNSEMYTSWDSESDGFSQELHGGQTTEALTTGVEFILCCCVSITMNKFRFYCFVPDIWLAGIYCFSTAIWLVLNVQVAPVSVKPLWRNPW